MITPVMGMTARVCRDLIFMAVIVTMAVFVRSLPAFTVVKRGYSGRSVRLDQTPWGDQGSEQQHQRDRHGKHPTPWRPGGMGNVRWVGEDHGIEARQSLLL